MATGAPYLVMEYLEGCDLAQLLEREGPVLGTTRAVNFTLQILRALQTAHAAGIVHRDMKPSNCFIVTKDGDPDFIKLVDFGISKVKSADEAPAAHLTRTNSALGTPLYMSPEQARSPRDVDHRTDLYSVGAILYEMLTARTPYTAPSGEYTEILFKIFTTDPEAIKSFRPDLPDGLAAVVHRALTRDLGQRFGSALDMAEALAPFGDERGAGMIARMRGTRPASNVPMPQSGLSVTPSNMGARATPAEATAQTYMANAASVPPRAVPTDVGVTREAPLAQTGAPARPRAAVFVAAAAVSLLIGGAGVVAVKSHSSTTGAAVGPDLSTPTVKPVAPPPSAPVVMATLAPPPTPTPTPAESPSASASISASAKPPARPAVNQSPAPAAAPMLPKQLGDVKFH
jgi:serine/threonine-protein kinase